MANSLRYRQLLSRIRQLESNLLPNAKLDGNYTKKESDLIISYVLLCHAEIECYFEEVAETKVKKALEGWVSLRKKSNCLLSIMIFCAHEISWDKIPKSEKDKIESRVKRVTNHFINRLNSNHGIKSENILSILLPLGIDSGELEQTWLNVMDNFGTKRGKFAHMSSRVQSQIDLVTEKNNINNSILPEISNIDLLIRKIN